MNAYLKRENKTCLPPTELHKTTKQKRKQEPEMQHSLCLTAKGRTSFLSSFFWHRKHHVQRVGRSPLEELWFIYQIKWLGMQWGGPEEKKWERAKAGWWSSIWTPCQVPIESCYTWALRLHMSARQLLFFSPLFFKNLGVGEVISLIHVTLHLQPVAPSTCSESRNPTHTHPPASRGAGPIVPIHVDRHTVCGVCIICLSALGLSCSHNGPVSKGKKQKPQWSWDWLANKLICFTNQQGKLQVQGCSTDSRVASVESTPPPHLLPTSILFWYWISSLNN